MKNLKRFCVYMTVYAITAVILSHFTNTDSMTTMIYFICSDILYFQQFEDK